MSGVIRVKVYHGILLNLFSVFFVYISFSDYDIPDFLRILTPICGGILFFTMHKLLKMLMGMIYKILEPLIMSMEKGKM